MQFRTEAVGSVACARDPICDQRRLVARPAGFLVNPEASYRAYGLFLCAHRVAGCNHGYHAHASVRRRWLFFA